LDTEGTENTKIAVNIIPPRCTAASAKEFRRQLAARNDGAGDRPAKRPLRSGLGDPCRNVPPAARLFVVIRV